MQNQIIYQVLNSFGAAFNKTSYWLFAWAAVNLSVKLSEVFSRMYQIYSKRERERETGQIQRLVSGCVLRAVFYMLEKDELQLLQVFIPIISSVLALRQKPKKLYSKKIL